MRKFFLAATKAKLLLVQAGGQNSEPDSRELEPRPEMVCFRTQTLALVRHFFEISSQVGRVSSLLGREFFRARVSHHAIPSFEEQIVFVRDVELCLARLDGKHAEVLTLLGLYDYSYDEVSQMLQCSRTLVRMWFNEALDSVAEMFLRAGLLRENRPDRRQRQIQRKRLPADVVGSCRKPPQSVGTAAAADSASAQEDEVIADCEPCSA